MEIYIDVPRDRVVSLKFSTSLSSFWKFYLDRGVEFLEFRVLKVGQQRSLCLEASGKVWGFRITSFRILEVMLRRAENYFYALSCVFKVSLVSSNFSAWFQVVFKLPSVLSVFSGCLRCLQTLFGVFSEFSNFFRISSRSSNSLQGTFTVFRVSVRVSSLSSGSS